MPATEPAPDALSRPPHASQALVVRDALVSAAGSHASAPLEEVFRYLAFRQETYLSEQRRPVCMASSPGWGVEARRLLFTSPMFCLHPVCSGEESTVYEFAIAPTSLPSSIVPICERVPAAASASSLPRADRIGKNCMEAATRSAGREEMNAQNASNPSLIAPETLAVMEKDVHKEDRKDHMSLSKVRGKEVRLCDSDVYNPMKTESVVGVAAASTNIDTSFVGLADIPGGRMSGLGALECAEQELLSGGVSTSVNGKDALSRGAPVASLVSKTQGGDSDALDGAQMQATILGNELAEHCIVESATVAPLLPGIVDSAMGSFASGSTAVGAKRKRDDMESSTATGAIDNDAHKAMGRVGKAMRAMQSAAKREDAQDVSGLGAQESEKQAVSSAGEAHGAASALRKRAAAEPDTDGLQCANCGTPHNGKFGNGKFCGLRCSKTAGAKARWGTRKAKKASTASVLKKRAPREAPKTTVAGAEDGPGNLRTRSKRAEDSSARREVGLPPKKKARVLPRDEGIGGLAVMAQGLVGERVAYSVGGVWISGVVVEYRVGEDIHRVTEEGGGEAWVGLRSVAVRFERA